MERPVGRRYPVIREQTQKNLPLGFVFAEEDFGDCGHGDLCGKGRYWRTGPTCDERTILGQTVSSFGARPEARDGNGWWVQTVAELFPPHNVRLDLPMARADAVKSAAAKGDADKQGSPL